MKLAELFLTQEDRAAQQQEKLLKLKHAIEAGKAPEVMDSGGVMGKWAWGDLRDLGLAYLEQGRTYGGSYVEERWVYSEDAPGPITLIVNSLEGPTKKIMQPGDATEWFESDYS